jgi:hypothetical protein
MTTKQQADKHVENSLIARQRVDRARPGIDLCQPTAKIGRQNLLYFLSPVRILRCSETLSPDKAVKVFFYFLINDKGPSTVRRRHF